jgi:hypothetical protein
VVANEFANNSFYGGSSPLTMWMVLITLAQKVVAILILLFFYKLTCVPLKRAIHTLFYLIVREAMGLDAVGVHSKHELAGNDVAFKQGPLFLLAVCTFGLGCGLYLFVRGPETLYIARIIEGPSFALGLRLGIPHQLTNVVGSLPTAIHAFSFSLITALLLHPSRHTIWRACLYWACIDSGFEFLQSVHSCPFGLSMVDNAFVRIACAYVSNGSFDWLDIASIWIGAGMSFLALNLFVRDRKTMEV